MFRKLMDKSFAQLTSQKLDAKLKADYHPRMSSAYSRIKDHEKKLSEQYSQYVFENAQMDVQQMDLAYELCGLLHDFYSEKMGGIRDEVKLDEAELAAYEAISLRHIRYILVVIFMQFIRISGEIRDKYKTYLSPSSMRWESFQRLTWIINSKPRGYPVNILFSLPEDVTDRKPIDRFFDECSATEVIVEPVVYGIIRYDVLGLKKLALIIKLDILNKLGSNYQISFFNLNAMSAFVKREGDNLSIIELLELTLKPETLKIGSTKTQRTVYDNISSSFKRVAEKKYEKPATLRHSSKFERHASLQRLYRIGELLTGKHLSLDLPKLDATTDWSALITIRDAIAHPEERANYSVMQEFLSDNDCLDSVINDELPVIATRITKIIYERDKRYPKFNDNPEKFWNEIFSYEKDIDSKELSAPLINSNKKIIVSKENKEYFIDALKKSQKSREIIQKVELILDGQEELPSDQREFGKFMQTHLPPKGLQGSDEREKYIHCKSIIDEINSRRSSLEERESKRKKDVDEKKQRDANREMAFVGLKRVRELAGKIEKAAAQGMTAIEIINACIVAVENMIELMKQVVLPSTIMDAQEKGVQSLKGAQRLELLKSLKLAFKNNATFRMALEYNANQCFQYMDRIKDFDEIKPYQGLIKSYELTRSFRNYIAHGNLAVDTEPHEPDDKEVRSPRYYLIPSLSLLHCVEFLPYLGGIYKDFIEKNKTDNWSLTSKPVIDSPLRCLIRYKYALWGCGAPVFYDDVQQDSVQSEFSLPQLRASSRNTSSD